MTITVIPRATLSTGTDAASFSTGAFTPGPGKLLIACYSAERVSLEPSTPTVSGHNGAAPWALLNSLYYTPTVNTRRKLFLFACTTGGSPAIGVVTFAHGSTHLGAEASVFEIGGDDSGHGLSQTFVQIVNSATGMPAATSLSLTLAPPGHQDNRPFGFFMHLAPEVTTQRTSWTEIHDVNHAAPAQNLETQWRTDSFETTASASWASSSLRAGMAFQIKALVLSPPPAPVLSGIAGNSQNTLTWTAVT